MGDRLGVSCATPDFGLGIFERLFFKNDFSVVRLVAFFEILGVVAGPGRREVGKVVYERFGTVPELHGEEDLVGDFLESPASTGANLELFIPNK